ncbi:23S rRNA pseudouridine2604 synthase [Candidatus Magnetomoraceae bacterium gMMP-15]
MFIRLQKYLSQAGICSRRKGEKYITEGLISVNGQVVTKLGTKIDPERDNVKIDSQVLEHKKNAIYIALNKPEGYVTSCSQPGEKIILDLINLHDRIYPVGRLDKDSCGLLLLTNDGDFHNRFTHPSFNHEKEYIVTLDRPIPDGALYKMRKGMPLMGTRTRPSKIHRISPKRFSIILKEGKNRQIRRMVRKVGNNVIHLKRIRIANIHLGRLGEGTWRYLTKKEKKNF